jgi:hypothetical protein
MADKWDERKKAQEDEYFVKKERELLAKLKAKQEAENKAADKNVAHMTCPKCGQPLRPGASKRSRSTNAPDVMAFGWMPVKWSKSRARKVIVGSADSGRKMVDGAGDSLQWARYSSYLRNILMRQQ